MTKRQDLCLQRRSRPEQSDQRQANQAKNISHQPRASPNSTSLASRIEFPTMTTIARPTDVCALQVADIVAYEICREEREIGIMRYPLQRLSALGCTFRI